MHEVQIVMHTCSARQHSLSHCTAAAEIGEPGWCLLFMKWRLGYMVFNKLTDDLPSVSSYILSILWVFIRTWIQSRLIGSPCFEHAVWDSSFLLWVAPWGVTELTAIFSEFIYLGLGSGRCEQLKCSVPVWCLLCWEFLAGTIPCNHVEFSPDQFVWQLEILSPE